MNQTIKEGLDRYTQHHVQTGSFLRAVLENDLRDAVCRADDDNMRDLREIVMYVYWELPGQCWGSPELVRAWLAQKPATAEVTTCQPNA